MIDGHGNDWYNTEVRIVGDFSSNVPYINNSDVIVEYIKSTVCSVKNYPDPNTRTLTKKLAGYHNVDPRNILVTNGSSEAFYLIAQLFASSSSLVAIPSFAEYADSAKAFGHDVSFIHYDMLEKSDVVQHDVLWLATPNNPDGRVLPSRSVLSFAMRNPKTNIVVDFAYSFLHPYVEDNYISKGIKNVISVHSMTKSFAIPGLRLGYIIADGDIIDKIKLFRVPWSVSSIASNTAEFIIDNYTSLLPDVKKLIGESKQMQCDLDKISDLSVFHSDCNFFITKMKKGNSSHLKQFLLDKYGLLIRDASNFRGLDSSFFRLSVQNSCQNELLIRAINDYYSLKQFV